MEGQDQSRALAIEALNTSPEASLLAMPLDYISSHQYRQRILCRVLDEIADQGELDMNKIAAALRFLETHRKPHASDKEEDLFPLLRRRAAPDDKIDDVI